MSSSPSAITPASITAHFSMWTLTLIAIAGISVPTFATLKVLQWELNANALSVYSSQGNGSIGHLVLTYSPANLQALPNHVPFIIPLNPGQNPTVPAGATAEQIRVITRAHTNDMQDWNTYHSNDNALKQQLRAACPHLFLKTLMHTDLGFALVSTLTMLSHLWDTYGSITHADIMANNTTLTTNDWGPPMPMEGLFTKITRCVNYAAAGGAPIIAVMVVQAAYNNIEVTGLFTDDCKVWRNKPVAEKTYTLLKEFFTNADQDRT